MSLNAIASKNSPRRHGGHREIFKLFSPCAPCLRGEFFRGRVFSGLAQKVYIRGNCNTVTILVTSKGGFYGQQLCSSKTRFSPSHQRGSRLVPVLHGLRPRSGERRQRGLSARRQGGDHGGRPRRRARDLQR